MKREDFEKAIRAEGSASERTRTFASILANVSGVEMIIVGGSAIELYTGGDYVSGDIDLVTNDRSTITTILRGWGFRDEAKLWTRGDLGLVIDPMQTRYQGDERAVRVLKGKFGSFRVAAPEDLLIGRLREIRAQSTTERQAQALFAQSRTLVAFVGRETLDWQRLRWYARKEGWLDLLEQV